MQENTTPKHAFNLQTVKINKSLALLFLFLFTLPITVSPALVKAEEFSSDNFVIRDPVTGEAGGRSTSTSFELFDISSQIQQGEGTSTGFIERAGFLYFPIASIPVVSVTAGANQVALTWTVSTGILANITDYEVGVSTVTGGPYTFESVGNVLTFTKTGLTGGTTYYFRVRALAGTLQLAKSEEVSATPTGAAAAAPTGGGGGVSALFPFLKREPEIARILKLCDFNNDGRCNIVDFSILLYYIDKPIAVASRYDLNSDEVIDIIDISILLFYWTD